MARRAKAAVNDRPSKWRMLLRRQRWLLRPLAWTAAGLVVLGLGAVLLQKARPGDRIASIRERIGVMTAEAGMRIKDISISGRANTPEPLVLEALGVNKGDPIVGFSLDEARRRIERLTWVAHATVERRLPDTIAVVLWERRPFAVWQNQHKFVLIDRDGQAVDDEEVSKFQHLPLIVGPGAPKAAHVLLDALTARPEIQRRVLAATRIGEIRWNLRMKNGTDIMLPEGHEIEALDRLLTLQMDTKLLDRPLQTIDMRLADRLVLKPYATRGPDSAAPDKPASSPTSPPAAPAAKKPA